MRFPETPKHRTITLEQALLDLLDSIAKEEEAVSQLLNAEANKTLAFIGKNQDFPTSPTNEDIINYCQSVNHIVDSLFMKEWLLLRKLDTVLQTNDQLTKWHSETTEHTKHSDKSENEKE